MRLLLSFVISGLTCLTGSADPVRIRIDRSGFGVSTEDIHAVCQSAGEALWQHMDGLENIKVVVSRGKYGPIAIYGKNDQGEIQVRLDTSDTYWSQYAYQFAHEMCHVLCHYENDYKGNLWFEETLAETSSLYCLRRMSVSWRDKAPYKNWRSYAPKLRDYTDNVIRKRVDYVEILKDGLPAYYRKHAGHLRKNPTYREKNGAIAVALLAVFEREPSHWNAIRWVNSTPSPEGETFQQYLEKWHATVPRKHKTFVMELASLFGIRIQK